MQPEREIATRTRRFAAAVVLFAAHFPNNSIRLVLLRQLVRAGTSIGANVEEAQDAISRREFTHKVFIALREARETRYWLRVIEEAKLVEKEDSRLLSELMQEVTEITRVLTTIGKRARDNV